MKTVSFNRLVSKFGSVAEIFETLTKNEQFVLYERNEFGGKKRTLDEIGFILGVTRERVRQIEAKASRKLKTRCEQAGIELVAETIGSLAVPMPDSEIIDALLVCAKEKSKRPPTPIPKHKPELVISGGRKLEAALLDEADRISKTGQRVEVILVSDREDAPNVVHYEKRGQKLGKYRIMPSKAIRENFGLVVARSSDPTWEKMAQYQ